MNIEEIVKNIIKEQSMIIGKQLAQNRASDSGVVTFNSTNLEDITVTQNSPKVILEKLITSYSMLFGQASVEVCLNVIKKYAHGDASNFIPDSFHSLN